ncbi:MAG: collagenase [Bacteroidetes bacterium RIFOXYA12_FULL_35_11]|nr:MAG: collagenase [Bacteroidetes bacterium GWF2_35_48]OFY75332.1 MAG: collagenase [Bacteroidetes bacterium RIFOXYA12_FULL_35_11]OFY94829.1 MAG: collagenase [Bacteroidetes bacterium RIFOXYC12_FULL_35_7]OFY96909.1 MAG: collagenase [Bacteroidetes bacterium RIFOXYB2_FULL_35_7]HBX53467.1 collagenase-like protease [Bacteroidales bacterium]
MTEKIPQIELMAPVGSFESLAAAIQGGANAVYFGVEHLNMRSKSSVNFTLQNLKEISAICREHNIRSYLTVNTVIYDEEKELMMEIVSAAKENNIDAVIASDLAVISYARSIRVEVHLSTQLNISNYEALKFYANYADVAVLARELNLKQVAEISKKINEEQLRGPSGKLMQIEVFCHGALCMAISGKCYLSLHEYNYSANRGACLQICRRAYSVTEKESGNQLEIDHEYIMSPKDLCTIGFLDKIVKAGVTVLKIEGRARGPEYVKTVTECYREALDAIVEGTYNAEKIEAWEQRLSSVFNRSFWDGYYLGRKLGEWSKKYGSASTRKKMYVGKVMNYFSKLQIGEILLEAGTLEKGDEVLIIGPTTGVLEQKVEEIRVDLKSTEIANKGELLSMPVKTIIRRADKLYKWIETNDDNE